jgi:hypothetical protein
VQVRACKSGLGESCFAKSKFAKPKFAKPRADCAWAEDWRDVCIGSVADRRCRNGGSRAGGDVEPVVGLNVRTDNDWNFSGYGDIARHNHSGINADSGNADAGYGKASAGNS